MEAVDCPIVRRKRPWGLTFFGLLAVGGLVAMPLVAGDAGGVEMPDWVRFLGHFHPVLLHLPIGVFAMILFQELGAIFGRRARDPGEAQLFPMFFGAASAIVAVIAGFLLYHGHGDDFGGEDLAERHLWGGLVFAIMPDEIRAMVESMVETGRMSGGYMMCIGNHIPFNVPGEALKRYLDLSAELAYR